MKSCKLCCGSKIKLTKLSNKKYACKECLILVERYFHYFECSICYETLDDDIKVYTCKHAFHGECTKTLISCPICYQQCDKDNILFGLKVSDIMESQYKKYKKRNIKIKTKKKAKNVVEEKKTVIEEPKITTKKCKYCGYNNSLSAYVCYWCDYYI